MQNYDKYAPQAFLIQSFWRSKRTRTARSKEDAIERGKIKFIFTSITGQHYLIQQNTQKFNFFLHLKQWDINKIDISEEKCQQALVKSLRAKGYELPFLFINDFFLGGIQQVQELEDSDLLDDIINKSKSSLIQNEEYLERCLLCLYDRQSVKQTACTKCSNNYTFFAIKY